MYRGLRENKRHHLQTRLRISIGSNLRNLLFTVHVKQHSVKSLFPDPHEFSTIISDLVNDDIHLAQTTPYGVLSMTRRPGPFYLRDIYVFHHITNENNVQQSTPWFLPVHSPRSA